MSTAFLVDNILNDKEDRSDSVISDTDSDATSDLKDSLCGSPESNENITPPHHYYHHHHHHIHQQALSSGNTTNQLSETLLRTYNTMIRNSDCATSDDHSDDASNHFIEMCCTKCGHFQQLNKTRSNNGTNGSGTITGSIAQLIFKLAKYWNWIAKCSAEMEILGEMVEVTFNEIDSISVSLRLKVILFIFKGCFHLEIINSE